MAAIVSPKGKRITRTHFLVGLSFPSSFTLIIDVLESLSEKLRVRDHCDPAHEAGLGRNVITDKYHSSRRYWCRSYRSDGLWTALIVPLLNAAVSSAAGPVAGEERFFPHEFAALSNLLCIYFSS